jgi:SRSO17 transposase
MPARAWLSNRPAATHISFALVLIEVGVARQNCGQLGKQDTCQVAVSLSVATHQGSLPVAYRLYLPKEWADDPARRAIAGVPDDIGFQTKPEIALQQVRQAPACHRLR